MSMQDPVANMLAIIKNGQAVNSAAVKMPSSTVKVAIVKVLKEEGYISDFSVEKEGAKANLVVALKYHNGMPVISALKRISKSSLRVYRDVKSFPTVMGGLGVAIISTSKGVMSDRAARAAGIGGEVLCTVE
jgi:small subunit ribosomal protein S8